MSRWLLHYTVPAVLLRLCSVSILLSYACVELFRVCGASAPSPIAVLTEASCLSKTEPMGLERLSRALPLWIFVALTMLVLYFSTQQDISVESITTAQTRHGDVDVSSHPQVKRSPCMAYPHTNTPFSSTSTCNLAPLTSTATSSNCCQLRNDIPAGFDSPTPDPRDRASVQHATEDRRRRHELRAKCTAAIASSSLLSLVALVGVIQFISLRTEEMGEWSLSGWLGI